jgi:hypothetical protein
VDAEPGAAGAAGLGWWDGLLGILGGWDVFTAADAGFEPVGVAAFGAAFGLEDIATAGPLVAAAVAFMKDYV